MLPKGKICRPPWAPPAPLDREAQQVCGVPVGSPADGPAPLGCASVSGVGGLLLYRQEAEAQRGSVACLMSHSQKRWD